ncbi:predicted protein [Coccidioides posadasii str. Silveira]|uniref:Predicted protein n=1 Tax=Coccidioides posadasii (strain RMSCC 757 / Silveira) TaxID=443226 RepID=E9DHC3_COCPS|nr:predicted protein [Coccidioides posadasii str. Silveira]
MAIVTETLAYSRQDWVQAGRQLDLAIQDYYIYNSDARYYDVEDFIWEKTQKRHYLDTWRIEWERYQREIGRNHKKYDGGNYYLCTESTSSPKGNCDTLTGDASGGFNPLVLLNERQRTTN